MIVIPDFILIEETISKFEYDPTQFKGIKDYKKLVIRICFKCGNTYEQKFIYAVESFKKNKKCKYCSNKENSNKNLNLRSLKLKEKYKSGEITPPMLNKTHSCKTKEILRNHILNKTLDERLGLEKSTKAKQKMSESHTGDKNHFFGKKHSEESLNKMRISAIKNVKRGKESHFYGKIYHPKNIKYEKNGNIFYFKSTWELKVADYLSSKNINWEYESKKFEMIIDNRETTYTPDFFLTDYNTIIEVKGYWRDDAIIKFNLFKIEQDNNFIIEVWDKHKLKSLNII